jgi:hypothetical protein
LALPSGRGAIRSEIDGLSIPGAKPALEIGAPHAVAFLRMLQRFCVRCGMQAHLARHHQTFLFEITDQNFHGVAATVTCPDGRSRSSFAVYCHTAVVNGEKEVLPRTSIYAPSVYQPQKSLLRRFAKQVTPPIVHRALHTFSSATPHTNGKDHR